MSEAGERLLIDANVLLLLVVGNAARGFIVRHKRLEQYAEADFDLLTELISTATSVMTTPNAWTEVSNIADFGVPTGLRDQIIWQVKAQIEEIGEIYVESAKSVRDYAFYPLGLLTTLWISAKHPLYQTATRQLQHNCRKCKIFQRWRTS